MVQQEIRIQTCLEINKNISILMNSNGEIFIWKNRMENAIHIIHMVHRGSLHSSEEHEVHPAKVNAKHLHY